MSIINKTNYSGLGEYGVKGQTAREKTFFKVFITGEPRTGQNVGEMQCATILDMEHAEKSIYILNNYKVVNFIPMFLKRIREAYSDDKNPKLTYFCWDETTEGDYPQNAKCAYLIAGAALDENLKPIPDKEDPSKTALIYFKCNGIKMGGAIDFLNSINASVDKLELLSDDPEFEQSVISWRRFVIKTTVITAPSNFGNKYVFKFEVGQQIPDEKVKEFLDKSNSIMDKFKTQFDYSDTTPAAKMYDAGLRPAEDAKLFQGQKQESKEQSVQDNSPITPEEASSVGDLSNIDLGI